MNPCLVYRNKDTNEIERVLAPTNMKPSKLYQSIIDLVGDKEIALRLWAQTQTERFNLWFGNWRDYHFLKEQISDRGIDLAEDITVKQIRGYWQVSNPSGTVFEVFDTKSEAEEFRNNEKINAWHTYQNTFTVKSIEEVPLFPFNTKHGLLEPSSEGWVLNVTEPESSYSIPINDEVVVSLYNTYNKDMIHSLDQYSKDRLEQLESQVSKAVDSNGEPLLINGLFLKHNIQLDDYTEVVENISNYPNSSIKSVFNRGSFLIEQNDVTIYPKSSDGKKYIFNVKVLQANQGDIIAKVEGEYLVITGARIISSIPNTGTYAYMKIAEYADKMGLRLSSDDGGLPLMTDAAVALWDRFVAMGLAEYVKGDPTNNIPSRYIFTGVKKTKESLNDIQFSIDSSQYVSGFTKNGEIYLVKDRFTTETVLHEFSHGIVLDLFNQFMKESVDKIDQMIQNKEIKKECD